MRSDLFTYQDNAVARVVRAVAGELEMETSEYRVLLDSPTGSGKTVMLAAAIEEIAKRALSKNQRVAFLWLSPGTGGLDNQSAQTLRRELDGVAEVNVVDLDPSWAAGYEEFLPGDVAVVSWEESHSIDKDGRFKNRLTRDGEQRNMFDLLEGTRVSGTRLVVVVDEAHHAVGSGGSTDRLLEAIRSAAGGAIEIHATATPNGSTGYDTTVKVKRADVVAEGVVAKTIYINEGTEDLEDAPNARDLVLRAGLDRLERIAAAFDQIGSSIQPLLLVQLPDSKAGDAARTEVETFFRSSDITTDNGKLAIWLEKEKSPGLDRIDELTSPIRVLLFKQAVAKGWDCPRAYVLVRLRSTKSVQFNIQTIGRICRQPERKHYQFEPLDNAFIYTDTDRVKLEEDVRLALGSEVEHSPQVAKLLVDPPTITAASPPSQTRPTLEDGFFAQKFEEAAGKADLANKVVWGKVKGRILRGSVPYEELKAGELAKFTGVEVDLSANQTQDAFDERLRATARPYQNQVSAEAIRKAVYKFLSGLKPEASHTDMQHAALASEILFQTLRAAVDAYRAARPEDGAISYEDAFPASLVHQWKPPRDLRHPHDAETTTPKGYAYSLRAPGKQSAPEKAFEQALAARASAGELLWWWKNGDKGRDYFAVPYRQDGGWHLFYPDYLVMWADGTLGIYEVKKAGDPEQPTRSKAEGLAKWITDRWGSDGPAAEYGICVEYPAHGGWFINDGISYSRPLKDKPDAGGNWVRLERLP